MRLALYLAVGMAASAVLLASWAQAAETSPDELSGLKFWLDATDTATVTLGSGTEVSSVANKGDSGVGGVTTLAGAGSPDLVADAVNGLSALYFDGGDHMTGPSTFSLFGDLSTFTGTGTLFTVFVPTDVGNDVDYVMQIDRNGSGSSLVVLSADLKITKPATAGTSFGEGVCTALFRNEDPVFNWANADNSETSIVQDKTYVAAYGFDYMANGGVGNLFATLTTTAYEDPIDLGTVEDVLDYSGVDENGTLSLGGNLNTNYPDWRLTGYLAEVIIYDAALTETEIGGVTEYLQNKYDVFYTNDDLPGDLNDDGFVGGDDLDIVRSYWGQTVELGNLLQGDPSEDGFVGGDDLDIVRANWGQGVPPAPTAVPEPGLLGLVLSSLLALAFLYRG